MMRLSIIIPTRDRTERLTACLDSLAAQTARKDHFEVIVVDDGSSPSLEQQLAGTIPAGSRFVWQSPAGLNAARNRGAQESAGAILAFLDDDTLVSPGWAHAVITAFADTGCGAVGGRVTLRLEGQQPRWLTPKLRRYLAEYDLGDEPHWIPAEPVPVGANCAVSRLAFDAIGGFALGLDRDGASLISNGDTEFFRRLQHHGETIRYVPEAAVEHCVPSARLSRDFFRRRARAQGLSDALLDRQSERPVIAAREWLRAGRSIPIAGKALLSGRGTTQGGIWLEYCRGRLSGIRRDDL